MLRLAPKARFHLARLVPGGVPVDQVGDDARHVLLSIGFVITRASVDVIEARSPGLTSTSQNPLLGAGHVTLNLLPTEASLTADLAGVRKLSVFVVVFPPLLVLFLYISWKLGIPMSKPPKSGVQLLSAAAVCLALSPVAVLWLRHRTNRALAGFFESLLAPR